MDMFRGILHIIGGVIKFVAAALVVGFSASLGYTFFSFIAPQDMPWFVWCAMGLTEIGFICWLAVFMMQKHRNAHKAIALVMVAVCFLAMVYTDAVELARLFHVTTVFASVYYYGLIALLIAHLIAFVADWLVSYPVLHGGENANLIRNNSQYAALKYDQTGYYNPVQSYPNYPQLPKRLRSRQDDEEGDEEGEPAYPLAQNQTMTRPKKPLPSLRQPATGSNAAILREGASSLIQKGMAAISSGIMEGRVPGNGKTNTSKNTSSPTDSPSQDGYEDNGID